MGVAIAVASGNGGAGKTATAIRLAEAFARSGARTLLWELNPGARCCDWLLGTDGVCFDLGDLLSGAVSVGEACVPIADRFHLLASPLDFGLEPDAPEVCAAGGELVRAFDATILDLGCGGAFLRTAARADFVLFCCEPDVLSANACERAARYAERFSGGRLDTGLAVTKIPPTPMERDELPLTLPELIDRTGLPLKGLIPRSSLLAHANEPLQALPLGSLERASFDDLRARISGQLRL